MHKEADWSNAKHTTDTGLSKMFSFEQNTMVNETKVKNTSVSANWCERKIIKRTGGRLMKRMSKNSLRCL